jgi:hypothetical protein
MSRELEVLRAEYERATDDPLFDSPSDYCVLLDLIQDRINEIEGEGEGECDKCANSYELSSRDNRCGDCGNCNTCCTHEGKGK